FLVRHSYPMPVPGSLARTLPPRGPTPTRNPLTPALLPPPLFLRFSRTPLPNGIRLWNRSHFTLFPPPVDRLVHPTRPRAGVLERPGSPGVPPCRLVNRSPG